MLSEALRKVSGKTLLHSQKTTQVAKIECVQLMFFPCSSFNVFVERQNHVCKEKTRNIQT